MTEHRLEDVTRVGMRNPTLAYLHAISPEHGEPVVFVPGEALPQWLQEAVEADRRDGQGRYLAKPDPR